ncbi:MAG: LysM peptidoglycan-binding domain-containing protein [Bacteroidales bacterium]|nr:LysM peptidoglycan-binding domain-containing protein [Bacteroidales bacterium]
MKKTIIILSLLFLVVVNQLVAQEMTPFRRTVENAYNFWIYTPPASAAADSLAVSVPDSLSDGDRLPLVVFLHGSSLCGSDLNKVRRYGTLNAIEMGLRINAIVLAPQNPGGSWKPDKVMRLVDWTTVHYNVDTNRIYVLGMSLGGFGTIDVAGTYPHRFAAAMALCGGGTLKDYCSLNELPLWIMHGTADRAVSVNASQRVVDAMDHCPTAPLIQNPVAPTGDSRLIFSRLQGMNHGQLVYVFYLNRTYEWLFSHSLADPNRPVNRSIDIPPSSINRSVYRTLRRDGKVTVGAGQTGNAKDATASSDTKNSGAQYYTIKKGDTLSGIAKRHHTTVKKLCQLNGMKETTTLKVGRRIRVR